MSNLFQITRPGSDDSETPSLYRASNELHNEHVDGRHLSNRESHWLNQAVAFLDANPNAVSANYPGMIVTRA